MGYEARGRTFDQFHVGDEIHTACRTVTEADVVNFAGISGDYNPLHSDEELMKKTPFGGRIAHGVLILAIATGLMNQLGAFEGTTLSVMELNNRFARPVKFGDTIRAVATCKEKKETSKPERGVVVFLVTVLNQRDEVVLESEQVLLMKRST